MDNRWILDQLISLGKFDAAQSEQIKELTRRMNRLDERPYRAWPIVISALIAFASLVTAAFTLFSLYHQAPHF